MPPTKKLFAALSAVFLLVACGDDADTAADAGAGAGGITVTGDIGVDADITVADDFEEPTQLVIEDLAVGDGDEVPAGATVTVHYAGVLVDGTQFDASFARGQTATFPLDGVIQGWTEGIPGMKVGGRRLLVIPPELAYGAQPPPGIPPDATLIFVVDLVDF